MYIYINYATAATPTLPSVPPSQSELIFPTPPAGAGPDHSNCFQDLINAATRSKALCVVNVIGRLLLTGKKDSQTR